VLYLPQDVHLSTVFFVHTSRAVLYVVYCTSDCLSRSDFHFLVSCHRAIFSSTQIAVIFLDQASKCSCLIAGCRTIYRIGLAIQRISVCFSGKYNSRKTGM